MPLFDANLRRPATCVAVAALCLAGTGVGSSSAHLPGVDPVKDAQTYVVVTGNTDVSVAVDTPDLAAGTVRVTLQNNTGGALSCGGFDGGATITVATAEIAARSFQHYADFPVYPDPTVIVDGIPTQDAMRISLGSLTGALPSTSTTMIWPEAGNRALIGELYDAARLRGQVGRLTNTVNVPAFASTTVQVRLGQPNVSPRSADYHAGALVGCTIRGANTVFAGYQPGTPQQGGSGSLAAQTLGRFGS